MIKPAMNRKSRLALSFLLLPVLLAVASCDKATPVAPTNATLKLTVSPGTIGSNQTANVSVEARKGDGFPVNPGTEITLSTTLGSFESQIITTDDRGLASTKLRGDGRTGDAKIRARSGAAESDEVTISIGVGANVTLQASPSLVRELTADDAPAVINLQALIRDSAGQPLSGALANFTTTVGRLDSRGGIRSSNNSGIATDRLTVGSDDITALTGQSFPVSVEVSGAAGALVTDEATITVARRPRADFTFTRNGLTVSFRYRASESGSEPTSFEWDFGDTTRGSGREVVKAYTLPANQNSGSFTVTLTVSNSLGEDTSVQSVDVQRGTSSGN
jgi:hypothetical protein